MTLSGGGAPHCAQVLRRVRVADERHVVAPGEGAVDGRPDAGVGLGAGDDQRPTPARASTSSRSVASKESPNVLCTSGSDSGGSARGRTPRRRCPCASARRRSAAPRRPGRPRPGPCRRACRCWRRPRRARAPRRRRRSGRRSPSGRCAVGRTAWSRRSPLRRRPDTEGPDGDALSLETPGPLPTSAGYDIRTDGEGAPLLEVRPRTYQLSVCWRVEVDGEGAFARWLLTGP